MNNPCTTKVKPQRTQRSLWQFNHVTRYGTLSEAEFGLLILVFMVTTVDNRIVLYVYV